MGGCAEVEAFVDFDQVVEMGVVVEFVLYSHDDFGHKEPFSCRMRVVEILIG